MPAVNGTAAFREGCFIMPAAYELPDFSNEMEAVFSERLRRVGNYARSNEGKAILTVSIDAAMPEEGYQMDVAEDGVQISVSGKTGYGRALETLFVLLASGEGSVGCTRIQDAPRFARRSVMLDCCRHFFSIEEIKRIIEQASLVHVNLFHWHLSDDQGFRIESKRFPRLNEVGSWRNLAVMDPMVTEYGARPGDRYGGFYTQKEICEVVSFASARGVDVVPEIDLPGHSSAILSAFPEFTCSGEPLSVKNTFGVHSRIFCAGKEETFRFLTELIDETAALFPSAYFHIGGDEAPKAEWKRCPRCRAKMTELGYTSYEQLQCWFTSRLAEHLKAAGKTPVCWNESAISGGLALDAVVQYWAEMGGGESYCAREAAAGRKFLLSNDNQFYCTDSYAAMSLGCTLNYEPNVKGIPIADENVLGVEMPMWSEWSPTGAEIEPQMYPRLLAMAECGWTKEKDEQNLLQRVQRFLKIPALSLLNAPTWEQVDIRGEAALQEIAYSLVHMGSRYHKMAEAEQAAGGEAGIVAAVEPDGSEVGVTPAQPKDLCTMVRAHVAGKMTNGFTEEEIDTVAGMVLGMMANRG